MVDVDSPIVNYIFLIFGIIKHDRSPMFVHGAVEDWCETSVIRGFLLYTMGDILR